MIVLILFAFIGGIITILSPCILPVLPIVLSGSLTGGRKRPLGIVTGFILSFTFFTLFLSAIVKATGISADSLRYIAVFTLIIFGISLFLPKFQVLMEQVFSKLSSFISSKTSKNNQSNDFLSGIPIGASLGLIWTPCVGPIIASVITLAATSQVTSSALLITLAYSLGTALPMLAITYGGRQLLQKNTWLLNNTSKIQRGFGVLMVLTAIGIFFNIDRTVQTYILTAFPQYGTGLTALEDNAIVKRALNQLMPTNSAIRPQVGKPMNTETSLPRLFKAPGFTNHSGEWINSEPLQLEDLKGNVVLVDFWTYTCINCIRTLPYLRRWHETYKDTGLIIVGVHTPEFEFEKSLANVKKAASDFQLAYPIVQDNEFGIWRDYSNRFWPAKYLVDKDGYVRYTHFGEGAYDETEQAIQKLLKERGSTINTTIKNPEYDLHARTPELYLGYERIQNLISPERVLKNIVQQYTSPNSPPKNYFGYEGSWTLSGEHANPDTNASLILHFDAKEVFLVMRPKDGTKSTVRVYLNDQIISSDMAGEDVQDGIAQITEDRLYKLVNQQFAGPAILKLVFDDDNTELFAFTFG